VNIRIQIQVFDEQKLKNLELKIYLIKTLKIFLIFMLLCVAFKTPSPKETTSTSKHDISSLFVLFLWESGSDPDPKHC